MFIILFTPPLYPVTFSFCYLGFYRQIHHVRVLYKARQQLKHYNFWHVRNPYLYITRSRRILKECFHQRSQRKLWKASALATLNDLNLWKEAKETLRNVEGASIPTKGCVVTLENHTCPVKLWNLGQLCDYTLVYPNIPSRQLFTSWLLLSIKQLQCPSL